MGVLFVLFLFICVREHIAINTNENASQLPVLNQQIQDASALSLRYSATEYIIPSHQNVLYTITPKASTNNVPAQPSYPTLSKTTDGQRNPITIATPNCLAASSMRGPVEQSVRFQNDPEVCKEIHAVNNYAPTGCFSIDNAIYPIYMKDDLNNIRDCPYSKYLPRPSLHICNSPNAVGLSYSTIDINEMDKDINQSMNAFYKEEMCNNMRLGLQNLQNEKCSVNQIIQQSTKKIDTERKPTTKSIISSENTQSLNRNNIDKTFLTNPLTRECDTLKPKITPSTNNYNGQFISEASCPSNPFIITENNRNKDTVRSENIKEVNNNYQALQRNAYNSAYSMSSSNTLTNNRDLLNLLNNQVPETCHLFNTVKESITESGCKRNLEPTLTMQSSNLQGPNKVQCNVNNNSGQETTPKFNTESNSQKYKTIDNIEKHVIDKKPCYSEPRLSEQQFQDPFKGVVSNRYNILNNEHCNLMANENKLINENNSIYDAPKLSTGKKDSEHLNISRNNQQPNMELSMSNEDLQKQIEKIKQRYILAQSPIQSCTENKQKSETVIDENKLPELNKFIDITSANSAQVNQFYAKENKNLTSSIRSSSNYLPTLNNKTNYTLTTNSALNELKNSLDWLPNYMKLMNYNNVPPSVQEYTERGNKQFSFQDMKAINDEDNNTNPNQFFTRIDKEPSVINRASNTLQNYDNYIPNNYKKEPLNLIQESSQKNYILPTSTRTINEDIQSYNLNQNICEIKSNREQEARGIFTNLPKEFNLNNNYIRRDVPLMNPSKAVNTQGSTTQNAPRNLNPTYNANIVNSIQNNDDHYPVISVPQYQIIDQPKASPITIHPKPIQPTVIQRPGLCTDSAKPIIPEQHQVYTRVTSNVYDSQFHNPERNLLCDSEVRTAQGNPCSSINLHNTEDLKYPKPSNLIESILSNTPISNDAITPNLSPKSFTNNPVMCNESPNDRYSSLISTSLNNIASVLFTNMLTSLKKNVFDNRHSRGTSENSSTSPQISNTNLPLLPELSQATLDVPVFSVIPPCVESPRLLPDPFILENNTSSMPKSVSKTNKRSKSKNKSVDNFISTITINVLPSVQQTSHEIVILI
ncbi:unnamed protein product [Colias eurytheme]|nr:unnamed protein product [Colias eurytheme]